MNTIHHQVSEIPSVLHNGAFMALTRLLAHQAARQFMAAEFLEPNLNRISGATTYTLPSKEISDG
jgi:hypothetical protein